MNEARLRQAIGISAPGTKAEVELLRDGKVSTVTVALADREGQNGAFTVDAIGVSVRTLTETEARAMGYRNVAGVIVVGVDARGRAANATPVPVEPGDIIATGTPAGVAAAHSPPRYLQLGDLVEAERQLRNLIRRYPLFADARAGLTALLWQRGAAGEAESHWAAASGLDPRYRQSEWLSQIRRWPPEPVHALENFLALASR